MVLCNNASLSGFCFHYFEAFRIWHVMFRSIHQSYQQITIITMGGVLLFAFLPMETLRAIKHKSEKNDVFIERNDKNGGYE